MKYTSFLRHRSIAILIAVTSAALWHTPPAVAADLTWDITLGDGATITGGIGTWANGTGNWNTGAGDTIWSNTTPDAAIFGGTAGTITLGSAVTVGNMIFNAGTGNYTIAGGGNSLTLASSTLSTNTNANISAALGGTTGLIKAGTGTLTFAPASANTYTGTTTVKDGTLKLDFSNMGVNAANMLPSTNNLTFGATKAIDAKVILQNAVGSGATSQTLGTITNGRGASYFLADPAAGTTMAVTASNVALGGTRGWNSTNGTMIIGVMNAAQESQLTFNLTSTTAIDNGGVVTGSFLYTLDGGVDPANLYFAGKSGNVVSRRTADINVTDNSTTDASSTFQLRVTTTQAGQIWTNPGDISAKNGLLFVGTNDYTISGGTLGNGLPGSGTQNTRGIIISTWGTGALTVTSNVTNGNAASQLTKQGPGTLILTNANTYPSATNINSGVLSISQIGNGGNNPSGLGISSNAATNLNLDGGTLRYTGAAASTDRLFRLNADSGIDASGAGALNWTNTGTYTVNTITGPKTLTLKGTNTGANTLAGILSDENASTGQTSLIKAGTGTWKITAANTYSGGSTITGGTLNVTNTTGSATGTGNVTVDASGTLAGTGKVTAASNNYIYINGSLIVGDSTLSVPVPSQLELTTSGSGAAVLALGSFVNFDLFTNTGDNTSSAAAADRIKLFGSFDPSLGGTLVLGNPNSMGSFTAGDKWKLFDLSGGGLLTASWANLDYTALALTGGLTGSFNSGTGEFSIVGTPEPSRALLLLAGLSGMLLRRRRK